MYKNILPLLVILLAFISLAGCKKESSESNNDTSDIVQKYPIQEDLIVSDFLFCHFYRGYSIIQWQDEDERKYTFIPYYYNGKYAGICPSWGWLERGELNESFICDSLDELIELSCTVLSEGKTVVINGWSEIALSSRTKGKKVVLFNPDEIEYIRNKYKLLTPDTRVYEFRCR